MRSSAVREGNGGEDMENLTEMIPVEGGFVAAGAGLLVAALGFVVKKRSENNR